MGEPNSRSDQVNVLCSLAKDTLPSVSDSPPRCMCIHKPGELLGAGGGGRCPRDVLVSHPGGSSDTRSRLMLRKP